MTMNNEKKLQNAVRNILTSIGEDPEREGLKATPERVQRMYIELCVGYQMDLDKVVNGAVFNSASLDLFESRGEYIAFGSKRYLHMLYLENGEILWSQELTGSILSAVMYDETDCIIGGGIII